MERLQIGVTDQPRTPGEEDLLHTDPYSEGLCQFIRMCQTPMSIALQGDWGSGKTSILNAITKMLSEGGETGEQIKVVTVNTWQFAQIAGEEKLAPLVLTAILTALNDKSLASRCADFFAEGARVLTTSVAKVAGVEISAEKLFRSHQNAVEHVTKLRENFQELIDEVRKKNNSSRVVILIDDLDRLNPTVAVELLEAIKLFLDVENCVFVLAIDYDVVVKGVRAKFGAEVPEEKCRSFFDKIIQLPFLMPVMTYRLNDMVKTYLGDSLKKEACIEGVSSFATNAIGANPRAFKRLVNAFLLIDKIRKIQKEADDTDGYAEEEYALLFCVLCIQVQYGKLYEFLSVENIMDDTKSDKLVSHFKDWCEAEGVEGELLITSSVSILAGLCELIKKIYATNGYEEQLETLKGIIQMASVTRRDNSASAGRPFAGTEIYAEVFSKQFNSPTAKEAMAKTLELLFAGRQDELNAYIRDNPKLFATDNEKGSGAIRRKVRVPKLVYTGGGAELPVFVGTSSGTDAKKAQVEEICSYLKLPTDSVVWRDAQGKELFRW